MKDFMGIKEKNQNLTVVQKSKFYSFAYPVFTKESIIEHLNRLRVEYKDATHICYAYVVNNNGVQEKYSDDGEPQGTAGYPICAVIKKKNLSNVLVCVVRYFGGIKLGAGGLTRAYSGCASSVLDDCQIYQYQQGWKINIEFDSMEYFKFVRLLNSNLIVKKDEKFDNGFCTINLYVANKDKDIVSNQLMMAKHDLIINMEETYI